MSDQLLKDPLHQILEKHLLKTTEGEGSEFLVTTVLDEYLNYLRGQGAHIPIKMKDLFMQDLKEEIKELIIKKTYKAQTDRNNQKTISLKPGSSKGPRHEA